MIIDKSIKIKNYKCFDSEEQGFGKIYPLNIIIGKNNSGKSTLIELIEYVVNPKDIFLTAGRNKMSSKVVIGEAITEEMINNSFSRTTSGGLPGKTHHSYGMTFVGKQIKSLLESKRKIVYWESQPDSSAKQYIDKLEANLQSPLVNKAFFRITAERDVSPEGSNLSEIKLLPDGKGATNIIRHIVMNADQNLNLVRRDLLNALNEITRPDIEYIDIAPRERNGSWEIYLEDKYNNLIPLSKMGSGMKTILLVAINLIILPEIMNVKKSNLVLGFEELENNLHPSLQRRLLNYIANFAINSNAYLFITTHSSIVIDLFISNVNAQIIHVQNRGSNSIAKSVTNNDHGRSVLRDLDFKASDLLMSNGIIWVEGPSDVIYIELLFELLKKNGDLGNNKSMNYTIQSLATAIWKYAGFADFDWASVNDDVSNKIISLENLNMNQLLIIDNDKNYDNKKPSEWECFNHGTGKNKAKLVYELMKFCNYDEEDLINNYGETSSDLFFWVTEFTFETYLEHFVTTKGKDQFENYFDLTKERGFFEKKRSGDNHSKSKVELALEISKYCLDNNLSIDDLAPIGSSLRIKLNKLSNTILFWN